MLVIVLFIIAIGKTSVITFSFYGVLSLLPSVAITAVSWMFKNKVFKEGDEDNEPSKEKSEPGMKTMSQAMKTMSQAQSLNFTF